MLVFSLPIMLQGSFQVAYNIVDRFWVGQLGKEAMAAVSVGFPVIFFMISLAMGISIGAGIMIAQYKGANHRDLVNLTARNFIVFGSIVVIVIGIAMVLGTTGILRLLGTPQDFFNDAASYLRWIFGGLIFFFGYNAATGIFRGLGDSIKPVAVAAFSTIFNIALDPIFIFGLGPVPAMGVQGAGIATVIANAAGALVIFILLAKEQQWVDLSPRGFRFDSGIIRDMLRLGLPNTIQMLIISSSVMVVMRFVNGLGTTAVAAYGIGIVLDRLVMMPSQSFGMAMSTIAGQNIGAGKMHRVSKFLRETLFVTVGIAIVVGIILATTVPWIARIFQPEQSDYNAVFPLLRTYILIMTVRYVMMSMFFPTNGVIRGAGDAIASMMLTIATQLIIRVPAVIILVPRYGFAGVAISLAASIVMGLLLVIIYYNTGLWKKKALVKHPREGIMPTPMDDVPD
jgi:putative MATE family efflux protein